MHWIDCMVAKKISVSPQLNEYELMIGRKNRKGNF